MLESNYFIMLMKPIYERPIDTAQDVIDLGLTIISNPGSESKVEILKISPSAVTRALAELAFVPEVIFCFI